jgi:hypothetical protein
MRGCPGSSMTASSGVLETQPPSQYSFPSTRVDAKPGGSGCWSMKSRRVSDGMRPRNAHRRPEPTGSTAQWFSESAAGAAEA